MTVALALREAVQDGKTAALIEERITFPNSACAIATRLAGR